MKTKAGLSMITKLARKYLYGTKVYSAKQSPDGRKTPGQSQQSIRNGTIMIQRGNKKERLNIRRVSTFE
jgi:hypothetical protein